MLLSRVAHVFYLVFLIVATLVLFPLSKDPAIFAENGLMENLQAGCLVVAAVLFFVDGLRLSGVTRYPLFILSTLSVGMFLREVDVEDFDLPEILVMLGSGKGRAFLLIPFFMALFFIFRQRSHYLRNFRLYFSSPLALYTILAVVLVICGVPFDQKLIICEHRVFGEEMFELAGYYYFAIAALVAVPALTRLQAQTK